MNTSKFANLSLDDIKRGLITAVLSGLTLPLLAVFQTPGFDVFAADWHAISVLAVNGAVAGFMAYISKNFLTAENGLLFGKI